MSVLNLTTVKRLTLRLMVDHSVERGDLFAPAQGSHELGVVPLTKMQLDMHDGTYIAHARLNDWYAAIDPPKKKEVTTEEALLAAVNTTQWMPIMAWRDWLAEQGTGEKVIYGLTWLIGHKRFPEEGWFEQGDFKGTAYRWLYEKEDEPYAAHRLPPVGRDRLERLIPNPNGMRSNPIVVPRVFKTIKEAFWEAALAIGESPDKLPAMRTETNQIEDEEDDGEPGEYDSWPEEPEYGGEDE